MEEDPQTTALPKADGKSAKTYGEGDPSLDAALVRLHEKALAEGAAMYLDPHLGLWVQTSRSLLQKETCCGRGCRHCPFSRDEQLRAGRSLLRP